jgi:hypothetical protein
VAIFSPQFQAPRDKKFIFLFHIIELGYNVHKNLKIIIEKITTKNNVFLINQQCRPQIIFSVLIPPIYGYTMRNFQVGLLGNFFLLAEETLKGKILKCSLFLLFKKVKY